MKKLKPIPRFKYISQRWMKMSNISTILLDLENSRNEAEIAARLSMRLKYVKGRGEGLEAVLRDAVLGRYSKAHLYIQGKHVILLSKRNRGKHTIWDEVCRADIPFHVSNVIRHHRQGKIKF